MRRLLHALRYVLALPSCAAGAVPAWVVLSWLWPDETDGIALTSGRWHLLPFLPFWALLTTALYLLTVVCLIGSDHPSSVSAGNGARRSDTRPGLGQGGPAMRYTVTVFANAGRGRFFGLEPDDRIAEVDTFTIEANEPQWAAEGMFHVGQKDEPSGARIYDADGKPYPRDVYSVSTGDLVKVVDPDGGMTFWACESIGWREIPEPTNPIVPLVGSGVTSRA